ncbi:MAG: hypothetical protein R3F59_32555 [Myxococcota bacterium]
MRWWTGLAVAVGLGVAGCEPGDPCADYVDYMCSCHAQDTAVDCDALSATYEDAGSAVQDECAVLLDEQESSDQSDGQTC